MYKGISYKVIKDLKWMYKVDFDFYGYLYELLKEYWRNFKKIFVYKLLILYF